MSGAGAAAGGGTAGSEMAKFDPWPVFFKREWGRNWPFLAGFAVTGILITKLTAGFTGRTSRTPSSSRSTSAEEEQRVIEAQIRMRHQELKDDAERLKNKQTAALTDAVTAVELGDDTGGTSTPAAAAVQGNDVPSSQVQHSELLLRNAKRLKQMRYGNNYKGYATREEAVAKWRRHVWKKNRTKILVSLLLTGIAVTVYYILS